MVNSLCAVLAALSIWEYPMRQPQHERLRAQFIAAVRERDVETMEETCAKGVKLLPEDPLWRYNYACSLARGERRKQAAALKALEEAIDLGFRNAKAIEGDKDFKSVADTARFRELLTYAKESAGRPLLSGPNAAVPLTAKTGGRATLGAQNLNWNLDAGLFEARLKLEPTTNVTGNAGDLYVNRDEGHSMLALKDFPGVTWVSLSAEARPYHLHTDLPVTLFPKPDPREGCHPVFGNVSRAMVTGPLWRSLPRAMTTSLAGRLNAMARLYLSNQTWVFPVCFDYAPLGTNGDVFASITPYCLPTQGRSWSDQYYLRAALEASRALKPEVKREIVRRGLLAPTIQAMLRKSLKAVKTDADYLTAKAHPTALPPNGLDMPRLKKMAGAMTAEAIPPLAVVQVRAAKTKDRPAWPEPTYATPFAVGLVLRAKDAVRTFELAAVTPGREKHEYAFAVTHDDKGAAKVREIAPGRVSVTVDRTKMSPTNRVDVAVFAKNPGTDWGAPSYVSFAVVDPTAPYSDPVLTPLAPPKIK